MASFFQQTFTLLTTPPGNLVYHLVLAFTLIAALQPTLVRGGQPGASRRARIGLGLILLAQVLLFALSGLAWQGLIDAHALLPPLDRGVTFFSLVWIAWLWAFPEPSRPGDAAAAILSLLAVLLAALTLAFWAPVSAGASFNGSWFDLGWELLSLAAVLLSGLLLFVRRTAGWGFGLGMIVWLAVGHVVQAAAPTANADFSGALRLAQMAAYPLLLALVQREPVPLVPAPEPAAKSGEPYHPGVERRRYSADPKAVYAFLDLARETSPARLVTSITRAVGQAMLADLCYLTTLPDAQGQVTLQGGYDLIREDTLPGATLPREKIPQLATALQKGRALRLYASSSVSPDLAELGNLLGLHGLESLLAIPLADASSGGPMGGILLLSPYSNRLWTAEDQAYLATTAEALAGIIGHVRRINDLRQDLDQAHVDLELARGQLEQARADQENVVAEFAAGTQPGAGRQDLEGAEYLESELRQSLKEVAYLKNALAQANMQLIELEKRAKIEAPLTSEQTEVIASLSQELRQPMSSITGYTDLLLGESVGILGALQRKFLERIGASTERMRSLVDDLIQVSAMSGQKLELETEAIDLGALIDNALAYTSAQVREKNLTLHLDLPEHFPQVHADRDALQQIVIHLLQNATAATPMEGAVRMKVGMTAENDQDFVLLQVTDTGGGIPDEDLPRVFSRRYRADNALIQGVGDTGVGLSIAKTLVEAHGGRIWVDSQLGQTTTFSVLLPALSATAAATEPAE